MKRERATREVAPLANDQQPKSQRHENRRPPRDPSMRRWRDAGRGAPRCCRRTSRWSRRSTMVSRVKATPSCAICQGTWPRGPSTNCGRNARKNRMTLGLMALATSPLKKSLPGVSVGVPPARGVPYGAGRADGLDAQPDQIEAAGDLQPGEGERRGGDQRADADRGKQRVIEAAERAAESEGDARLASPCHAEAQDHQVVRPGRERDEHRCGEEGGELRQREQGIHGGIVPHTFNAHPVHTRSTGIAAAPTLPGNGIRCCPQPSPPTCLARHRYNCSGCLRRETSRNGRPGGETGRHKGLKIPRRRIGMPVRLRPRAPAACAPTGTFAHSALDFPTQAGVQVYFESMLANCAARRQCWP